MAGAQILEISSTDFPGSRSKVAGIQTGTLMWDADVASGSLTTIPQRQPPHSFLLLDNAFDGDTEVEAPRVPKISPKVL